MHVRRLLLFILLLTLFPVALFAQEDDSFADAIPITPGESINGELTADTPLVFYRFSAKAGDTVTISLFSPGDEVDTYLLLLNSEGRQLTFDDDGGEGRNSQITNFEIPADGDYIIVANSYGLATADQPRFGAYELTLELQPSEQPEQPEATAEVETEAATEPPAEQTPEATAEPETTEAVDAEPAQPITVTLNENVSGEISADNPSVSYQFSAVTGNLVSIIVTADGFDPHLAVRTPDGRTLIDSPSLEAGNVSIADLVILVEGDYVVEVSGSEDGATGTFDLTLNGTLVELPEPDPDTFTVLTTPGALALEATEEVIELAYGTTVDGTLTEAIPLQQFLFRAEEGDILNIQLSGDFDTLLVVRNANGLELETDDDGGGGRASLIADFVVPATGEYLLDVSSHEYVHLDTPTAGSYSLQFDGVAAPVVEIIPPEPVAIGYGETVEGALTLSTPYALYTFDATAGDVVGVQVNGDFDSLLILQDADENELVVDDDSGEGQNALIEGYQIAADGTYTIVVDSYDNNRQGEPTEGSYTLSLTVGGVPVTQAEETPEATADTTTDETTAAQGEGADTITVGESVSGELTQDAPSQQFTLQASAGDVITVDLEADFDAFVLLYDADGNEVASDDDGGTERNARIEALEIPADGDYVIEASSYGNTRLDEPETGTFTLTVTAGEGEPLTQAQPTATPEEPEEEPETATTPETTGTPPPPLTSGNPNIPRGTIVDPLPIEFGETVSGELTDDVISEQYVFSASAGDVITVDMSGDFDTYLFVYDMEGVELARNDDGGEERGSRIEGLVIPAGGEYVVQADSYGHVGLLEPRGGSYTLTITLVDQGAPVVEGTPEAEATAEPTGTPEAQPTTEATTTPTATPEAEEPAVAEGEAAVEPVIQSGETVTGELTEAEPNATYRFSVNAGESVTIDLQGDFDTYLIVLDGDGGEVASDDDGGDERNSRLEDLRLEEAGDYFIIVTSYDNAQLETPVAGSYTLSLDGGVTVAEPAALEDDATIISVGESVDGELTEEQPSRQYTFSASAGDAVTINLEADYDGFLFLYDSDGNELAFNDDGGDDLNSRIEDFEIPADGDYVIQVDSYANARLGDPRAGSYTLSLSGSAAEVAEPAPEGETTTEEEPEVVETINEPIAIEYGDVVEGELTAEIPQQAYVFTASAGDAITIDLSATFDTYLVLLDSEGEEIIADDDSGEGFNARITIEIPADGEYTIIADSYTNAQVNEPRTGAYTLSLAETEAVAEGETTGTTDETDRAAVDLAIGDTVTGTLSGDVPETIWTFSASEGDTITILLTSEEFDAYLLLFDEDGNEIAFDDDSAGNLNARIGPLTIPADGTYAVVASSYEHVGGGDAERGDYTLTLAFSVIDRIEYGEQVQERISQAQSFYAYEFMGREGDLLTVDLDTPSTNIYMTLATADGEFIAETYGDFEDLGPITLPADNTYVLNVTSFDATEAAAFSFVVETVTAEAIEYATDVAVTLDEGQNVYTFEGAAGDMVTVTVDSGGAIDTRLRLLDPDGLVLSTDEDGGPGFDPEIFRLVLPQSGTYTVVVDTTISGMAGDVLLRVEPEPAASIDSGPQVVYLSTDVTQGTVTFNGTAGETVALSVRVRGGNTTETYLTVSQDGSVIATNNIGLAERVILEFTIPADGEVRVLIEDFSYAPLTLELELIDLGGN